MDTTKFDQAIADAQGRVENSFGALEKSRVAFLEATIEFIAGKWEELVKNEVTRKPEITNTLGKDKLSQLKTSLVALSGNAKSVVDASLGQNKCWPLHDKKFVIKGEFDILQRLEWRRGIEEEIRMLLGHAGKLLIEFGYIGRSTRESDWEFRLLPRFRYGFEWSAKMKASYIQYENDAEVYVCLVQKQIATQKAKDSATASELWNSV